MIPRLKNPVLFWTLLVLALVPVSGFGASSTAEGQRTLLASWSWKTGDDPSFAAPAFDDGSWDTVVLPKALKPGAPETVFWMRTRVRPGGAVPAEGLWFLSGKSGVAFELYVNGIYVGSRGSLPPRYAVGLTHSAALHVPSSLLVGGEAVIALRCAFRGSSARILAYRLGDAETASYEQGTVNFWNNGLYVILAALCLFLGVYFLFLYLFNRSEEANLWYALTLLFVAVYFFDMGSDTAFAGTFLIRAVSRPSLMLSMLCLVPFFMSFFRLNESGKLKLGSLGIGAVVLLLSLVLGRDENTLNLVFSLSLLPILASIGFGTATSLRAARSGNREAWPVLAGMVVGIGLSCYDVYFQVVGREPFAWLQGIAFFLLNLAIFIALSMRQARLKADLERNAKEVEAKTAELVDTMKRMEEAGVSAATLAAQLDAATQTAAAAVETAAERSRRIETDTDGQAASAREADRLVGEFIASIERINGSLEEQNASVERTAAAVAELSAGAETVAQNIEGAASFAGGLAEKTGAGERVALSLAAAMERISASTRGIGEVVEAVNDFAERTNLLAMNAAIEAAHAGNTGRGFSIIAGEVKKLAQAQSERAGRIKVIVGEIGGKVAEVSRNVDLVRASLREIAAGAVEAAGRMDEARAGTGEQKRASADISGAMEALASAGISIREESARQAASSRRVRSAVASIVSGSEAVRASTQAITTESRELVAAVSHLRELSAKSRRITASLAALRK